MFKNIIKITIRNLLRRKVYTFINLFGLIIGMISFIIIFLYVNFEFSYDTFHDKADLIYRIRNDRIYNDIHDKSAGCPPAIGPAMEKEYPEIIESARLYTQSGNRVTYIPNSGNSKKEVLSNSLVTFNEEKIFFAEDSFLKMFSFPVIKNIYDNMLEEPNTAVITESAARKYFGKDDPLNKIIKVDNNYGNESYKITGILKDIPENSHIKFDILFSFPTLMKQVVRDQGRSIDDIWGWNAFNTYVLLDHNADRHVLQSKFSDFIKNHNLDADDYQREFSLQQLRSIHLHSNLRWEPEINGNAKAVNFLSLIAILIILTAWINYINLSTAKSALRAKEIGVRKVLGSQKKDLIRQFLFESILLNVLALGVAVVFIIILLPAFSSLVDKPVSLAASINVWGVLGLSIIVGSLLSGIYPAFTLSSFTPIRVLKGGAGDQYQGSRLRAALVVFQFIISIVLITSTIVVYNQLVFMTEKDLGINIEQILVLKSPSMHKNYQANIEKFENDIRAYPSIKDFTASSSIPGKDYSNVSSGNRPLNSNPENGKRCFFIDVDQDFFALYQIEFLAGSNFSESSQYNKSIILNEQAVRMLGFGQAENAITQKVYFGGLEGKIVDVVGVVKNYHHKSLNNPIQPVIFNPVGSIKYFSLEIDTRNIKGTLAQIEKTWRTTFSAQPFEYYFLDDIFNAQYKFDRQFGKIFGLFTILAIVISCLGLFGLISFSFAQRTREIGVRKVFGASIESVVLLLTNDLFKLMIIANVLATPLAWYAMNKWLQNFAYRIELMIWPFLLAGLAALVIALLTVSWQAIRAATANPVEALRYE